MKPQPIWNYPWNKDKIELCEESNDGIEREIGALKSGRAAEALLDSLQKDEDAVYDDGSGRFDVVDIVDIRKDHEERR